MPSHVAAAVLDFTRLVHPLVTVSAKFERRALLMTLRVEQQLATLRASTCRSFGNDWVISQARGLYIQKEIQCIRDSALLIIFLQFAVEIHLHCKVFTIVWILILVVSDGF